MRKRLLTGALVIAMVASLSACGDSADTTTATTAAATEAATEADTEAATESTEAQVKDEGVTEEATEAASEETTEAGSEAASGELTKEKYDSMTAEDLLAMANIQDTQNLTDDEYYWLLDTYKFVDIDYDKLEMDYFNSITYAALKQCKGGSSHRIMDRLVTSEYPQVRGVGYGSVSGFFGASDKNVDTLVKALESETDEYCLFKAVDGLSNEMAKDPKVAEFIFKMAEHPNPLIRKRTAIAIGNTWSIGVEGTVDKIIELMHDEDIEVRKNAVEYAGKLHDDAVVEPIVEILNDPAQAKVHGSAIRGLAYMWLDFPFHKETSEAAYRATMDYYSKTPRNQDVPAWDGIGAFDTVSEKALTDNDWYSKATYFDPDEFSSIMADVIADPDVNWLARGCAMKAVHSLAPDHFDSLEDAANACGDQKAVDEFNKQKEKYASE